MVDTSDDSIFADYTSEPTAEAMDSLGPGGGGKLDFYKFTVGAHALRLLPRMKGQSTDLPWVPRAVRWLRYGNLKMSIPDRRALLNDPEAACPVSDMLASFLASGEPAYVAIAEDAKPKYSYVGAVLPCPGNTPIRPENVAASMRLIEIGPGVYRDILKVFKDPMLNGNTLYHPANGFPIAINRAGEGMNTEYTVTAYAHLRGYIGGSRESALEAVKSLPDLDKLAAVPSVEFCQKLCDEFLASLAKAAAPGPAAPNAGTAMAAASRAAGLPFAR